MTAYGVRSEPGPRADAEPSDGLPTIRPGLDRVPTRCERCGSTFLGYEEPLGPHQRGMLWCQSCSRSICWVAAPARRRPRITATAPTPLTAPRRLIVTSTFDRRETCGLACTSSYGHDPLAHERAGADAVHAEIAARASGDIATGPLVIQLGPGRVIVDGRELAIAAAEYRMLAYLAGRLDELCTSAEIIVAIMGTGWTVDRQDDAHLLRTYMNRLRGRLGPAACLLETEVGRGYRLRDAPLC